MIKTLLPLTILVAAGAAAPAMATTTLLDFSGNICGTAGGAACGNSSQISQGYGDSAAVDVSYRSISTTTNDTYEPFLKYWNAGYGDLGGVVWGGGNEVNFRSEIILTPLAGYEIALLSLDAGCYQNRASCQTLSYDIRTVGGAAIAVGLIPTLYPTHGTLAVNSGYFSDSIILQWGPDGYDVGLDNILFDVRAVAGGTGAVPEPATWALMIGGFGMVGAASRRRRRHRPVVSA